MRKAGLLAVMVFWMVGTAVSGAFAAGLIGPPQSLSRPEGGLSTAVGFAYDEEPFKGRFEHVMRAKRLFTQAAYGKPDLWEVCGSIGLADMKLSGAFSPPGGVPAIARNDFHDDWQLFGAVGARAYYPATPWFGIGAFAPAAYPFGSYSDQVIGLAGATPFAADMKVKQLWSLRAGIGLQATVFDRLKLYGGPYLCHAKARVDLAPSVSGMPLGTDADEIRNKTRAGGFAGAVIPLAKGFAVILEGRYAERFSIGSAVTYTY